MARENLTADGVREIVEGLGETGTAWIRYGGLYSKREENADPVFHGSLANADEAREVIDNFFR